MPASSNERTLADGNWVPFAKNMPLRNRQRNVVSDRKRRPTVSRAMASTAWQQCRIRRSNGSLPGPPERLAMQFSRAFVVLTTALLCACVPAEREFAAPNTAALTTTEQTQDALALSFVEEQCSGCHALRPGVEPPNPQAPSFVAVANNMGFNQDTLREFFRDGHDTPDAMSIMLTREEAELASAYIMSLRSPR